MPVTKSLTALPAENVKATVRAALVGENRVISLLVLTGVAWLLFSFFGTGFLSSFNINSLTQQLALTGVVGFAQAALMVLGRINLAVGGIGVVVVMSIGLMSNYTPAPLPVIMVIALFVGAVAGAIMAVIEIYTKLNSFVVTLAFLSIYQGGVLLATRATHFPISSPALLWLGNGTFLSPYLSPLFVVAIGVAILLWLFYGRTSAGWKSRAVGANERTAAASGINVRGTLLLGYVISGLMSAVAAIMATANLAEASPSTGSDWLLLSFIGPLLAVIALSGGTISIGGIVGGSLFYGSIFSGLVILNVPTYWLTLVQALLLLAALIFGQFGRFLSRWPVRTKKEGEVNSA